jgi:hypothetical protein
MREWLVGVTTGEGLEVCLTRYFIENITDDREESA